MLDSNYRNNPLWLNQSASHYCATSVAPALYTNNQQHLVARGTSARLRWNFGIKRVPFVFDVPQFSHASPRAIDQCGGRQKNPILLLLSTRSWILWNLIRIPNFLGNFIRQWVTNYRMLRYDWVATYALENNSISRSLTRIMREDVLHKCTGVRVGKR